jgi:rod shape-determining protein MreD
MFFFLIIALIISLLLEGTVTTLPLVLIVLLCLTIQRRDASIFPLAFFAGIFLDILTVHIIGVSSIFFTVMVFLILLYQRKYEINSYPFVAAAACLGSFVFLRMMGIGGWFWQPVISSFIAVVLFGFLRHRERPKEHDDFKIIS